MSLKNSIKNLNSVIKSHNVLTSEEECYCYAQDSANTRKKTEVPHAVVFVETIEDIQSLLRYANKNKLSVVSRGAGTNMVGACTCCDNSIVMNFSKMNKILDFDPVNMTMRVQPGVVINDIKKLAESEGLYFPPDPSNFKVSTIGGGIAQASGGAKSFRYGTIKDYILGLTLVMADGTVMKTGASTVKDAVGYHLNQLIVGSEGTLAIVAEAELKLIPKPETSVLITAYFDSMEDAVFGVNSIIKKRIFPSTIDFMDRNAINTVENFCPSGLIRDKECMLLIEVEDFVCGIKNLADMVEKSLNKAGASSIVAVYDEVLKEKIWTARRASYAAVTQLAPDVVTDDIIVPRTSLAKMLLESKKICDKYNLKTCFVGHVGDGNIHPQIALNLDDDNEFKNYMNAKSEMYAIAHKLGGTISAEHGIGIEKIDYVKNVLDECAIEYMRRIKKTFDPNNILNPGKIFRV